jgi:hypothetical protein
VIPIFYKQSQPLSTGRKGFSAYDHADTVAEAVQAYKRCRTLKTFILTKGSPDLDRFACSCCGRLMSDYGDAPEGYRGNRVEYNPRAKTFRAKHYMCAWGQLLGAIGTAYSVAEAGENYRKAEGPAVSV